MTDLPCDIASTVTDFPGDVTGAVTDFCRNVPGRVTDCPPGFFNLGATRYKAAGKNQTGYFRWAIAHGASNLSRLQLPSQHITSAFPDPNGKWPHCETGETMGLQKTSSPGSGWRNGSGEEASYAQVLEPRPARTD